MYKTFICLRYLTRKRITWFSVGSVLLGVMALVVVMSVMHGFTELLRESMHGRLGDIVVESFRSKGFSGYERLVEEIEGLEHVAAAAPRVESWAICTLSVGGELDYSPARFIGIIPEREDAVNDFRSMVGKALDQKGNVRRDAEEGTGQPKPWKEEDWEGRNYDFTWDDPEDVPEDWRDEVLCIPGSQLLGRQFRDFPPSFFIGHGRLKLTTIEMQSGEDSHRYFRTANTFSSGMWDYDNSTVYIPLDAAQVLLRTTGAVNRIMVRVDDARHIPEVVQRINGIIIRADYIDDYSRPVAFAWWEVNPTLLNAINLETTTMYILLFLLLVVAGFATVAILALIVLQKRRDIGILMALGADRRGILRVFLTFGLVIGLVGATLGLAAGVGFLWRIEDVRGLVSRATGFDPFPATLYYFNEIPKEYSATRCVKIWLAAVAVCLVASLYPAVRASRLDPVEIIRYE